MKRVLIDDTAGIVLGLEAEISHGVETKLGIGQEIDLRIGIEVGPVVGKVASPGTGNGTEIGVMRVDQGIVIGVGPGEKIIDEVIEMVARRVGQEEVVDDVLIHIVEAEVAAEAIHAREIVISPDLDPGQEPQRGPRNVIDLGP